MDPSQSGIGESSILPFLCPNWIWPQPLAEGFPVAAGKLPPEPSFGW
jgi:hypothetical protein